MVTINDLIFNDEEVEDEFRYLLEARFLEDDIGNIFNSEINFVPMDIDQMEEVDLPAVTFYIYQGRSRYKDDEQIQRYTPFTAEINVYTSGDGKVRKNRQLCNKIIETLQSNGPLQTYYCRGLRLEENTEVGNMLDSAYRRVIRMTGLCDNKQKLIKGE